MDMQIIRLLGQIVSTNLWLDGDSILQAAQDPYSSARKLVSAMANLRQTRKTRHSVESLLRDHAIKKMEECARTHRSSVIFLQLFLDGIA